MKAGIVLPMNLTEIERNARALMTVHGVGSVPFAFDNGKRRLGATHFRNVGSQYSPTWLPVKITLSRHYAMLLPEDEIHDVILHEIAHALAGKLANHGPQFMAMCRKVGAKPARCATPSASPKAPIEGWCPTCDKKVSEHHRMPRAVYVHRGCRTKLEYRRV